MMSLNLVQLTDHNGKPVFLNLDDISSMEQQESRKSMTAEVSYTTIVTMKTRRTFEFSGKVEAFTRGLQNVKWGAK